MSRVDLPPARLEYLNLAKEIEDLFFLEADLLDERRYEEWLALFTDDIRYWMPLRKNLAYQDDRDDITGEDDIAWIDDDKATLIKRVGQLRTGVHWAEEPCSRVCHIISNIRLVDSPADALDGKDFEVSSRFCVYRNRVESETDFLIGRRRDTLRRVGGELRIAKRKIILDQSVLMAKNLTMFF